MELQAKQNIITRRPQLKQQEVFKLFGEFESNGNLTVKSFCDQHQMTSNKFYYWLKRYRSRDAGSSVSKGFVPLVVKTKSFLSAPGPNCLFAEVNGIRLYQVVPPDYLKALAL